MVKKVSKVITVNADEFASYLTNELPKRLIIVDFFAAWCGPCKQIAPKFSALADEFPHVLFLKIDVDKCPGVAQHFKVRSMPTFKLFKDFQTIGSVTGASAPAIRAELVKHAGDLSAGQRVVWWKQLPQTEADFGIASTRPRIAVAGGGPAGALSALLLNSLGYPIVLVEPSPEEDESKSYAINLNERGQKALEAAGVLEQVIPPPSLPPPLPPPYPHPLPPPPTPPPTGAPQGYRPHLGGDRRRKGGGQDYAQGGAAPDLESAAH